MAWVLYALLVRTSLSSAWTGSPVASLGRCHFQMLCHSTLGLLVFRDKVFLRVTTQPDSKLCELFFESLDGLHIHVCLSDQFGHVDYRLSVFPCLNRRIRKTYRAVEQGAHPHSNLPHFSLPSPCSGLTPTTSLPQITGFAPRDRAGSSPRPARSTPSYPSRTPPGSRIRAPMIGAASLLGSRCRL